MTLTDPLNDGSPSAGRPQKPRQRTAGRSARCGSGIPDHQGGPEHGLGVLVPAAALVQQQFRGHPAELVVRLPDGGEFGREPGREGHVVVADHRDLVRDPDTDPVQSAHQPERDGVVEADHRGGTVRHRGQPGGEVLGLLHQLRRADRDVHQGCGRVQPGRPQHRLEPGPPVGQAAHRDPGAEVGDPLVPQAEQVLGNQPAAGHVVGGDGAEVLVVARVVDQDQRRPVGHQPAVGVQLRVHRRDDHAARRQFLQQSQVLLLARRVGVRAAGHQHAAGLRQSVLDPAQHLGVEQVRHVHGEDADQRARHPAQPAGGPVADEAQLAHRRLDPAAGLRGDDARVVEHVADGGDGDPRATGHVPHARLARRACVGHVLLLRAPGAEQDNGFSGQDQPTGGCVTTSGSPVTQQPGPTQPRGPRPVLAAVAVPAPRRVRPARAGRPRGRSAAAR